MTNEYLWKDILEALELPIFVVDDKRTVLFANHTCVTLVRRLGFMESETDVIGQPLFEAIPKLPASVAARYDELFANGIPQVDDRQFHLDGSVLWIRSNRFPIFTGKKVSHVVTMLTDETMLRAGQEALKKSEATARAIINSSTESIILVDRNGVLLALNETAAKRLGKPVAELIGKTGKEMLPSDVWRQREPQLRKVIETGMPDTVTDTRNGIAFEFTMSPVLDESGAVTQVSIFASDITARVRAEEDLIRIRQAVESSSDAIAMADADGNHVYSNKAFEKLFGYSVSQLQEAGGPPAAHKDRAAAAKIFDTIGHGTPWAGITEMVTRDGRTLLVEIHADAIFDREHKLIGLIGIHTDVTRQQFADEQLRQSEEKCRLQFQSIPVPTFIWEAVGGDFQLKDYNLAAGEMTKGGIVNYVGKLASQMYVHRPDIIEDLARCYQTQSTVVHDMPYRYHSIPEERYLSVSYVPIPPNLVLVHTVDLTEQKRVETELLKSQSTLADQVTARTGELSKQIEFDTLIQRFLTSFASCQADEIDREILDALRVLAVFTETDSAHTVLVAPDQQTYRVVHSWVREGFPDFTERYQNISFGLIPWVERKILRAEAVVFRTLGDFPNGAEKERRMYEEEGVKSALIVPLRGRGGSVSGALGLRSYTREIAWTDGHIRWLRTFGDAVANVLERKHSEEALKKSEQRLSLHVQQTPLAVIEWDTDFRVIGWNPAAEEIFGYTAVEALGMHSAFIVPREIRESVDHVWLKLMNGRGGIRSTNANLTKTGKTIMCEWYNTPLTDSDGRVIGVASLVQNVTDRVRAEAELAHAYEQLQAEQKALEKKNIALQEMVAQIQESKRITAEQIQSNLDRIILPVMERLGQKLDQEDRQHLSLVRESLSEILSPFVSNLENQFKRLSPREIEICDLIRRGYDSKQIADLRNCSVQTVLKQRKSIRKKLGLDLKKINLSTYLSSSFPDQRKHGKKKISIDKRP